MPANDDKNADTKEGVDPVEPPTVEQIDLIFSNLVRRSDATTLDGGVSTIPLLVTVWRTVRELSEKFGETDREEIEEAKERYL